MSWDDAAVSWDAVDCSWDGTVAGVLSRITIMEGAGQATVVGRDYPTNFVLKAWDGLNNPMAGVIITVFAPNGAIPSGTFPGGVTSLAVNTGPDGVATFPTYTANTRAGTYAMTAIPLGGAASIGWNVTQSADVPAQLVITNGNNQSVQVDSSYTTFVGRLEDQYANVIPATTVAFTAPTIVGPSGTWPGGAVSVTAVTNNQGIVQSPPTFRANYSAGPFNVRAAPPGSAAEALFACANLAGPPSLLLAASGSPQSAPVYTDYPIPFGASVTDQWGNGAPGIPVTFTAPAGSPSGLFANGTRFDTAVTGLNGVAAADVFTAGANTGTFRVAAAAGTIPGEAIFICTNMLARDPIFDDTGWEFVSPDGEGITLLVMRGHHGRLMPVAELFEEQVPGVPGHRYLGARHASRDIMLPCHVEAPNLQGLAALRQLARVLDPTKGIGSLRVRLADGTVRQIGATYAGGLDATVEEHPGGLRAPLVFRTPDPYWTDGIAETTQVGVGLASFELINDGDYETWPIIHLVAVNNPIVNPTLTNTASNLKIQINTTPQGVADLVIDCRPGHRSVVLDGRPNYGAMTVDSELWAMVVGAQIVTFATTTLLGFTTTFSWARRFLSI